MADKNNDCEMNGEDFSQDVSTNEENGGTNGDATNARDDDRYLTLIISLLSAGGLQIKFSQFQTQYFCIT